MGRARRRRIVKKGRGRVEVSVLGVMGMIEWLLCGVQGVCFAEVTRRGKRRARKGL